jgi:hypothetical protein
MPSTVAILNPLLLTISALWLTVGFAILVDRARHERHAHRIDAARTQLVAHAQRTQGRLDDDGRRIARRIGISDFRELARDGLPEAAVTALARDLRVRGNGSVRRRADGTEPADLWDRIAALQVMASSDSPDAYEALDRALRSGIEQLATAAVGMLTALDDRPAAKLLVTALGEGAYRESRLAAAFDRMTVTRADLLAPLFDSVKPASRFWAARLAARLVASEWADAIRSMTRDRNPLVRRAAVEALGVIGGEHDRDLLLACFADPVPFVRVHAARAAAAYRDDEVSIRLVGLLADHEWIVRASARQALRRLGDVATGAVAEALWDADGFAANSAAEVMYSTGAIQTYARRVLDTPSASIDEARAVRRFMTVAGPHLMRALLNRFAERERIVLLRHLEQTEASA